MRSRMLDCTCFHLPSPDNLSLLCIKPAHLYLQVKREVVKRPVTTHFSVQKKTSEDKQHNDFTELFCQHLAARSYEDDLPVKQQKISEYQFLLVEEFNNISHDFVLSAAIDLDENYYFYASSGYYIDKSYTIFNEISLEDTELSIFTEEEQREEYSKIFGRLQKIKQAVSNDAHDYLFSLLENLQLSGNYAHALTPIKTFVIDNHQAKLACSLRPDGRFSFIGAIEPDDRDNICFLLFEVDYELDESALPESDKEINSILVFDKPFSAKSKALAEVYDYLFAIFSTLQIKDQVIHESKRQAEQEEQDEQAAWNARMRWHQQNYTNAEVQAADPFHARYDPDLFAQLQAKLDVFSDLPLIDRKGIDTNARLAIGFIPTEEDDCSAKGNT